MARSSFGGRKILEGTVVSDKTDKTIVVAVETRMRHPLYKKIVRRLRRHMAHDESNDAKLGDVVRIVESRPHSRRKRWWLAEVLLRAERPEVAAREIDLELLGEVKAEEEEEEETAAAPAEAVAEEAAAEGEAEAPAEAAEEVPPVEVVGEAEAQPEEVPAAEAEAEEAPEVAVAEEPEAEAEEPTEAATEEAEGEEKEGAP